MNLKADASVLIIGHRGAAGDRPEHTAASFEKAIAEGADYIECDLVMTKDHQLIVRHENDISQTTDVATVFPHRKKSKTIDGRVVNGWFTEDFTLAEIKKLRARERLASRSHIFDGRYPVLTFREFLRIAKSATRPIGVYIETKHPTYFRAIGLPLEEALKRELKTQGLDQESSRVFVQSFELDSLDRLKKLVPSKRIFLMEESSQRPEDLRVAGDPRTYGDFLTPEALNGLRKRVDGIGPVKTLLIPDPERPKSTSLVKDAHAAGLLVHPFTFRSDAPFLNRIYRGDPQKEYAVYLALGIDGLFTDFPRDAVQTRDHFQKP